MKIHILNSYLLSVRKCICPTKVRRKYIVIYVYLKFSLPNASGAVNAASHDSFYKWPYIFVFDSPLERKQN